MNGIKSFSTVVAATLALVCLSGSSVIAATAVASTSPFGSVDMQKIVDAYSKKAAADAQMQQLQQQYQQAFKSQQQYTMLSDDEQHQLAELLTEANPSPADLQQISTLETKSTTSSNLLTSLQQEKNPSNADAVQLTQLTTQAQAGQAALQDVGDYYRSQIDQKQQQLTGQLLDDIRTAVSAVAQQKGLSVVFDSQFAIYTSNDISQAVINKLNGTK